MDFVQQRLALMTQEELDTEEFWKDKEHKKWAVDLSAGPLKRPTYNYTMYVRARTKDEAVECAERNSGLVGAPSRCRYQARLAGPRELGCVRR